MTIDPKESAVTTTIPPVLGADKLSQEQREALERFRELLNAHEGFEQLDEFFAVDGPDHLATILDQEGPETTSEHLFWKYHSMLAVLFPHIWQIAVADEKEKLHWLVFQLDNVLLRYEAVRKNNEVEELDFSETVLTVVEEKDLASLEITLSRVYQ